MTTGVYQQLEDIARQAKVIVRCEFCRSYVGAGDPKAEAQAYADVTDAWEHGRFQGTPLDELRELMKNVLRNADRRCPSCERAFS
jgi:hypothetical protein